MSDNRLTAISLKRACTEHHFDGYSAPCSDCRRATREAKYALLGCKRSPAPKLQWWYQHRHYRHYRRYSGDCREPECWNDRLAQWTAAAAQWPQQRTESAA